MSLLWFYMEMSGDRNTVVVWTCVLGFRDTAGFGSWVLGSSQGGDHGKEEIGDLTKQQLHPVCVCMTMCLAICASAVWVRGKIHKKPRFVWLICYSPPIWQTSKPNKGGFNSCVRNRFIGEKSQRNRRKHVTKRFHFEKKYKKFNKFFWGFSCLFTVLCTPDII